MNPGVSGDTGLREIDGNEAGQARLPLDFLLIGAQKCATSWLYLCLAEHPDICMPRKKRERMYLGGPWFQANGPKGFIDRYDDDWIEAGSLGDASVDYMYDPAALSAVREYAGHPKVIVSLRDPVDRMISGYYWLYRKGAFRADETANAKLASLLGSDGSFRNDLSGMEKELVARGRYARQLRPFIGQLGPERVFVLSYKEISSAPAAVIQRTYQFIGADESFLPSTLDSRPKRTAHVPILHRLERLVARLPAALRAIDWANQQIAQGGAGIGANISPRLRNQLAAAYSVEQTELTSLLEELPVANRPHGQYNL